MEKDKRKVKFLKRSHSFSSDSSLSTGVYSPLSEHVNPSETNISKKGQTNSTASSPIKNNSNRVRSTSIKLRKKRPINEEDNDTRRRRMHPSVDALAHIRQFEPVVNLINKNYFKRSVFSIAKLFMPECRFNYISLYYMQKLCEDNMLNFLEDVNECSKHAGRVTLMKKDVQLARRIRGGKDPINFLS
jgi:histone H3